VREQLQREAHRNQQPLLAENIPRLWILTPTASQRIITAFSAEVLNVEKSRTKFDIIDKKTK